MALSFPTLPQPFELWQCTLNWRPNDLQQQRFQRLYEGILRGNEQLNLTRITAAEEFWEKHLWDSLAGIAPWLADGSEAADPVPPWIVNPPSAIHSAIDIGTGGGFPGLPVAIARPDWHITSLDATRKKIAFLAELSQTLGLTHVNTLADRAEQVGHQHPHRAGYDLALIRAVGSASTCAEYALPLLKVNGVAVLYRGQWTPEEETELRQIILQLGGGDLWVKAMTTPLTQGARHYVYLHKQKPTPEGFPRAVGVPAKQPLRWIDG